MQKININTADELISNLKRAAKLQKRQPEEQRKQAEILDNFALQLGFKNWSLLQRDIRELEQGKFAKLGNQASSLLEAANLVFPISRAAAIAEMREFVQAKYKPLLEFAYYDSESESGYAWPDVDLSMELRNEFDERFPEKWIESVASDMEVDCGPWGLEDYGDDD